VQSAAEERLQRIHMLEAEVSQLLEQAKRWRATRAAASQRAKQQRAEAGAASTAPPEAAGAGSRRHQGGGGGRTGPRRPAAKTAGAAEGDEGDDASTVISGLSEEDDGAGRGTGGAVQRRGADSFQPQGGVGAGVGDAVAAMEDDDEGGAGALEESVGASSLTASEVYDLSAPGENRLEVRHWERRCRQASLCGRSEVAAGEAIECRGAEQGCAQCGGHPCCWKR
jgi:hypothetical protein